MSILQSIKLLRLRLRTESITCSIRIVLKRIWHILLALMCRYLSPLLLLWTGSSGPVHRPRKMERFAGRDSSDTCAIRLTFADVWCLFADKNLQMTPQLYPPKRHGFLTSESFLRILLDSAACPKARRESLITPGEAKRNILKISLKTGFVRISGRVLSTKQTMFAQSCLRTKLAGIAREWLWRWWPSCLSALAVSGFDFESNRDNQQ